MSVVLVVGPAACAQPHGGGAQAPPLDWSTLEAPQLTHHVQLTTRDQFVRAGEAYFSPDGRWIIFQAVATPKEGQAPEPFYAMYVARLVRDGKGGRVEGLSDITRISPAGTANTCGWFNPTNPSLVLYGSTLVRPADDQKAGFQVGSRKYVWMFPAEMEVVEQAAFVVAGGLGDRNYSRGPVKTGSTPGAVFARPNYDAECSYSSDGRFILYAHVNDYAEGEKADADIWVYDTNTKEQHALVQAKGYDGGPFFSPDGKRICYRSDRKGDDLLQLFVADLKFGKAADGAMAPIGIEREYQLTDNEHVNWAPYWHPSGRFLVYGTSEVGHSNYEVFAVDVDMEALRAGKAPADLPRRRITQASGADVLPAFSTDGKLMMWTSQRAPKQEGEDRASSQLWIAEWNDGPSTAD